MTGKYGVALPYDTEALSSTPAPHAVRVDHLIHQSRLADARLPHQGDHLALPGLRLGQGLVQRRQLVLPPHKGGESSRRSGLQAPAQMTGAHQLKHSTGSSRPFTGTGPSAVTCTRPSTSRRSQR